jgi:integrase
MKESGSLEAKSTSSVVKVLKSILNWNEIGTRDWRLRLPEIPDEEQRWFTEEEVETIIGAAEGQYKGLFRLAYASGMRPGELFGLHVSDFDFSIGTLKVQRGTFRNFEDTPKTQRGRRTIYVDRWTLDMIRELLAGRQSGRAFTTNLGTPLKDGDVNRDVLKLSAGRSGFPWELCMRSAMDESA